MQIDARICICCRVDKQIQRDGRTQEEGPDKHKFSLCIAANIGPRREELREPFFWLQGLSVRESLAIKKSVFLYFVFFHFFSFGGRGLSSRWRFFSSSPEQFASKQPQSKTKKREENHCCRLGVKAKLIPSSAEKKKGPHDGNDV